jgi:3-hydroxyacyl-[acyl-carrier-protein] dehydratase
MLVTRDEIIQYIPQRDPLVMIHDIVQATHTHAVTRFEVLSNNVFVKDGFLREPGLVENIAQTAAAQMGYMYKKKGMSVPIGYIASIKDLNVFGFPPMGAVLNTSVKIIHQVMNVILVEGFVHFDGSVICQCEMRIFIEKESSSE